MASVPILYGVLGQPEPFPTPVSWLCCCLSDRPAETEAPVPVHPSNVMITKIRETGSRRAILDRRGKDSADMDRVD